MKKNKVFDWIATIGIVGTIVKWLITLWNFWKSGTIQSDVTNESNESEVVLSESQVSVEHANIENSSTQIIETNDGGLSMTGNNSLHITENVSEPTSISPTTNDININSAQVPQNNSEGITF